MRSGGMEQALGFVGIDQAPIPLRLLRQLHHHHTAAPKRRGIEIAFRNRPVEQMSQSFEHAIRADFVARSPRLGGTGAAGGANGFDVGLHDGADRLVAKRQVRAVCTGDERGPQGGQVPEHRV